MIPSWTGIYNDACLIYEKKKSYTNTQKHVELYDETDLFFKQQNSFVVNLDKFLTINQDINGKPKKNMLYITTVAKTIELYMKHVKASELTFKQQHC